MLSNLYAVSVFLTSLIAFLNATGSAVPPAIPPAASAEVSNAKLPTIPKAVECKAGDIATFAVCGGKDIGYTAAFDSEKCVLVRLYSEKPDTLEFLVQPKVKGEHSIVFWLAGEKSGAVLTIRTPTPPAPPVPVVNPYRERLKAAFANDPGDTAQKDETRKDLAELYRQAVKLANDPGYTSIKQLRDKLKTVSQTLADDSLLETRLAIADIIGGAIGVDSALDAATRDKLATLFATIADALTW